MGVGIKRKMDRIFSENGKTFIVPMDHGITMGPIGGLQDIRQLINKVLINGANGIIVHKGLAEYVYDCVPKDRVLGIHLNAGTNLIVGNTLKTLVCTIENALYYGADFVSYHLNLGTEYESEYFKEVGRLQNKCREFGIPLLGMVYITSKLGVKEDVLISHNIRIAQELGFDMVKISCPQNINCLKEIKNCSNIPIIISGGEKDESNIVIRKVKEAIEAGASGIAIGRNVFCNERPEEITKELAKILCK